MADAPKTAATKPAMPAAKETTNMGAAPPWAIALGHQIESVKTEIRAEMTDQLTSLKSEMSKADSLTHSAVSSMRSELNAFGTRLGAVEQVVFGGDAGGGVASLARRASDHNLEQDSLLAKMATTQAEHGEKLVTQAEKLASVENKVDEALATLTDIAKRLKGIIDDPRVKLVGKVIFTAAMAYGVARGVLPRGLLP